MAESHSTRLEKLLKLLQDGKSEDIRRAAAEQIASVATNQPGQLFVLLTKITETLLGKRWEGRTAASYCLELIAKHCQHHTVESMKNSLQENEVKAEVDEDDKASMPPLSLDDINIHDLMKNSKPLVASEGAEFSIDSLQDQQTLQQQKKHLKSRLGLDGLSGQLVSTDDFIADEDFEINIVATDNNDGGSADATCILESRLSARERAMSRARKRKHGGNNGPEKRAKVDGHQANENEGISKAGTNMLEDAMSGMWPFQRISDKLCIDLLHPCWETRHGAALGLRSILRYHSHSAGVFATIEDVPTGWLAAEGKGKPTLLPVTWADVERAMLDNKTWIEECVMHLLCVLALDRFGDYISDGVIAPVRETAAQVLGTLAGSMSDELFLKTIKLLSEISYADHWESRHGAISALKYVLVARNEIPTSVFHDIVSVARRGLEDQMEDVRSASAECLIPCVKDFSHAETDELFIVIRMLWDALLSLDPINVATKSASRLLECLFMGNIGESAIGSITNIPRLWYHFSSKVASIRIATIKCYIAIIRSGFGFDAMLFEHHLAGLFSCIQVIVTDSDDDICAIAVTAAHTLIQAMKNSTKFPLDESLVNAIMDIALFTSGKEFNRPSMASLPEIQELVDLEELSIPQYVTKEKSSGRRFLICGIAASLSADSPKLETHLLTQVRNFIMSSGGLKKQIGSMTLLTDQIKEISNFDGMAEILNALNQALISKQGLDEFSKPYESMAESFARIGISDFDFRSRTTRELEHCVPESLKSDQLQGLLNSYANLKTVEENFALGVSSLLASAVIRLCWVTGTVLPSKLNNIIQPLIAGIRREKDQFLQMLVAEYLAELVWIARSRNPSPSGKIVKNLCLFACADRAQILDAKKSVTDADQQVEKKEDGPVSLVSVTSRGGNLALNNLVSKLGSGESIEQVPSLWKSQIMEKIKTVEGNTSFQTVIDASFILKNITLSIKDSKALRDAVKGLMPWLHVENYALQKSISQTIAAICKKSTAQYLPLVLENLDSIIKDGSPDSSKLGGITLLSEILNGVGMEVVPYVSLIVVYVMRRMSDHSKSVREIASKCFAQAVALMPLAHGVAIPEELSSAQKEMILKDGNFLEQLLNNDSVEDYALPFKLLTGTLRQYQQEGINWLAFLGRFGLHGVLADDMGLGKTIQSTAIMAAATQAQRASFESSKEESDISKPSLVVCPATLVSHWPHEISKFVSTDILEPLRVHGKPQERKLCYDRIVSHSVVVISYETLRADIDILAKIKWLYIVLDEGHAIRNPTSKLAQAAQKLNGRHRLILSGTPIQNSIMEIWAMFEFLMPGYLGDRKTFNAKYGRSVEKARKNRKESAQEQESIIALQSLHKQIMPFILRRTKDQVLKDLPPKILQDIMCDPSPLQTKLLCDFNGKGLVESLESLDTSTDSKSHIFQELSYLRKLCSHPLLVLEKDKKSHHEALQECVGETDWDAAIKKVRDNVEYSPKLAALKELLSDCGIGQDEEDIDAGHRVLVFAQTKAMLNLVETSVLNPMKVSYLRIDGTVDAVERFNVVQKFNADPTIDVMLLTTSVGGLGLNLTSADTVIFMEHDWNPQKDLQAMDRAHRLGQKRSVNVYRLLVKETLEESIMSLQRFKLDVAAAVVNADNMSMKEMDTGSLLDLFPADKDESNAKNKSAKKGLAAILADLPSLEETEANYAKEFSVDSFKANLQDGRRESS